MGRDLPGNCSGCHLGKRDCVEEKNDGNFITGSGTKTIVGGT